MRTSAAPAFAVACACGCALVLALLLAVAAPRAAGAATAEDSTASGDSAASAEASDVALERIDALVASHAWELALRRVEAAQDDAAGERWEALERRRFELYRRLGDASGYAARMERRPRDVSPEFRRWALQGLLETSLAADDPARARAALERLADTGDADETRPWRERLVRLYLEHNLPQEALAVFTPLAGEKSARALHAEILLRAGRNREAFERVAGLTSLEARLWRLIALWRLDLYAPSDAVHELSRLVRELAARPRLQRFAWLARADAAARAGELVRRVHSLEQAFRLEPAPAAGLIAATPDYLWSAYLALARHVASSEDISLGEAALERADADQDPNGYTARALYAWHAFEADSEEIRSRAHQRLAASLAERDLGAVARALYTESTRFAPAEIPLGVRHVLFAEALERGDVRAAAAQARDLEVPPPGLSDADWGARRARVLLYGGEGAAAVELLERLIAAPGLDEEFVRRWVQVVFDLQTSGRHRDALALLESAYARVDNTRMQRELLYWRAESAAALGRFDDAAELYLRSAGLGGSEGRDPWGHSARFRAAEALAEAGLREDAEALYRGLLAETSAPARRLLIEQHIERLWLDAAAPTTP